MLILLFALFYAFPISLISSELSALMPSRHGPIIWAYRAFYRLHHGFGDFIGYLNAMNMIIFWTVETSLHPIIFNAYLVRLTGPLSGGVLYAIKAAIIISGFFVNCFDLSVIANITTILCIAMMIPFFVAFFWTLPDIEPSTQWYECGPNWPLAISTCIWEYAGFESLGTVVNEIGFATGKLYSAYFIAVLADVVTLMLPIISSAILVVDGCPDWYDGFFATSYTALTPALGYSVTIGAVIINWCIYVAALNVVSRMLWASAQPYFEVNSGGQMLVSYANLPDTESPKRIAINILPKRFIGELYKDTKRPVYATLVISIIVAISSIWSSFNDLVEFNLFTYFVFFIIECAAYLVIKHKERNIALSFTIPGGLIGAWCVVSVMVIFFCICFWILVVDAPQVFAIAVAVNGVLTLYFFVGKAFCHRMYQRELFEVDNKTDGFATISHGETDGTRTTRFDTDNEYQPLI